MTTDTFPKGATATAKLTADAVTIAGIAKGSGMIAPDMATMLVFIFTDAADRAAMPAEAAFGERGQDLQLHHRGQRYLDLRHAAALCHGPRPAPGAEIGGDARSKAFAAALDGVLHDLAHQVVRDGEGRRRSSSRSRDRAPRPTRPRTGSPCPSPIRRW